MEIFVLLGAPGVGKGTMAEIMCEKGDYFQLSTGQVLRDEIASGSELGEQTKSYIEKGELVPDEVVVGIAAKCIAEKKGKANGVLLDGFPRTVPQAEALVGTLKDLGLKLTGVVLLEAPEELLLARLTGRRMCRACGAICHMVFTPPKVDGVCDACGGEIYQRADDSEETIRNRLEVYTQKTQPLVDFYSARGELGRVACSNDNDANLAGIDAVIAECRAR